MILTPQEPRLIMIGVDQDNPWSFTGGMDIAGEGAPIKNPDLPPGNYGMGWNFVLDRGLDIHVKFDLFDGVSREPVDSLLLPTIPYFSGPEVAARASGVFGEFKPTLRALSNLFPRAADPDPMTLANRLLAEQAQALRLKMNDWVDFSDPDHAHILPNLQIMIGSSFQMLPEEYKIDSQLVLLPEGYRMSGNE